MLVLGGIVPQNKKSGTDLFYLFFAIIILQCRTTNYTFAADIWSIGCIAYELYTGRPLLPGETQVEQLTLIQNLLGPLPPHLTQKLHNCNVTIVSSNEERPCLREQLQKKVHEPNAVDFMACILHYDATTRLTSQQCLEHNLFSDLRQYDMEERAREVEANRQSADNGIEEDIQDFESHGEDGLLEDSVEEEIIDSSLKELKVGLKIPHKEGDHYDDDFEDYDASDAFEDYNGNE